MNQENKEENLNPEIIDLIELGNDWNKAFPKNSNTIISSTEEGTSREQIRERIKAALERSKALAKELHNNP